MIVYYLYFPFAAILAGFIYNECRKKQLPIWWAAVVLCAPVTAPYFIYQSRKEEGMSLAVIVLSLFIVVAGAEIYLYSDYKEENKYAHLPPITRQMVSLANNLRKSTLNLDQGLVRLENLSKVESRIHEISKTIEFIGKLRVIMNTNRVAIEQLVQFTNAHQEFFLKKDLKWVFHIQHFYNNRNVTQHYKSLTRYLDSFEELLRYTYTNFYNITELKTPESLQNYDEYYIRYRRAVDSHNRFNVKRIEFQNDYIKKFPDVKSYLPGERQTETFRLWD